MAEDDRAVEDHEEKEAVPEAGDPLGTPGETSRCEPPPEHIGQPGSGEGVIEVQAATPVPAGERGGLSRGFIICFRMTPMVEITESAEYVNEEEGAAERPRPAGASPLRFASASVPSEACGDDIGDQRQPDTQPGEKFAVVHGGLTLCLATVSSIGPT
ncbi:MAG: hypothetical protein WDN28_15955 [Chthoniobacter sp.]